MSEVRQKKVTRKARPLGPRVTIHNRVSKSRKPDGKPELEVGSDGVSLTKVYETWEEVSPLCAKYGRSKDTVWARWYKGLRMHGSLLAEAKPRKRVFLGKTFAEWAEITSARYNMPSITGRAFGQCVLHSQSRIRGLHLGLITQRHPLNGGRKKR